MSIHIGSKQSGTGGAVSRRGFLKCAAAAGGALAMPTLIPASALGRDGAVAPSERIVMGGIGIGGRGSADLGHGILPEKDTQFVAVCDVRKDRREAVKRMVDTKYGNQDCATYSDIREFLATRTDIDAVLIATSDRWHAAASVLAMRAGKDVYCEKPGSMTIAEGQAVVDAARRYARVFQTGTQRLSEANFTVANELLRLGRLGKIRTVRAHIAPWDSAYMNRAWLPAEPEPPRDELDWDAWLGPAPWRPYNSRYVRGGWHGQYDFHTSCIGEWGSHTFAQCHVALGLGHSAPVFYGYVNNETSDGMVMRFANGVEMVSQRTGWHGSCGVRFEGSEGWVACADGYQRPEVSRPSLLADYTKLVNDYQARTGRRMGHMRNFLDCVRTRQQPVADAGVMHYSMAAVHAANIAMWLKRDMRFDPVKNEFINDPEANRMRSRAMRQPWQI